MESGLGKTNLHDAQVTAPVRRPDVGEHLERRVGGRERLPLTVDLVLKKINRAGSSPAKQAKRYWRGEITKDNAVEGITRAILQGHDLSSDNWKKHAPAVEAALAHPLNCECAECL